MEQLLQMTEEISGIVWGWPMIILLLGTHIFLTIRLKFPQRKIGTAIRLSVKKDKGAKGDVSQFGALATSLAATIGTGNIIGVATAVSLGGPGAMLWCWLTGVFGIATKYSEGLLAIKYRVKTKNGRMLGGPMYALENGLGMKWLAVLFCVFAAVASFGIGNTVQANAISENLSLLMQDWTDKGTTKVMTGFVLAAVVGFVIIGGVKSIARWCAALVPMMALLYVLGCFYILCVNHAYLIDALVLIFNEAFSMKAVGGGTAGTVRMMAARYGIARGLFSNESGMGSAPIVAAAAKTKNPVRQALVSSTGTLWDTVSGQSSPCHGFMSHIGVLISRDVLGLDIPEVFPEKRVRVAPHPGELRFACGTAKTPDGLISVSWSKNDAGFELRVNAPASYRVDLILPDEVRGHTTVTVNGEPVTGREFEFHGIKAPLTVKTQK